MFFTGHLRFMSLITTNNKVGFDSWKVLCIFSPIKHFEIIYYFMIKVWFLSFIYLFCVSFSQQDNIDRSSNHRQADLIGPSFQQSASRSSPSHQGWFQEILCVGVCLLMLVQLTRYCLPGRVLCDSRTECTCTLTSNYIWFHIRCVGLLYDTWDLI